MSVSNAHKNCRGAPYDDFPESGWDKLMALNVKSIYYMTVGLEPLLLKGVSPDAPSSVINIASMAGVSTSKGHLFIAGVKGISRAGAAVPDRRTVLGFLRLCRNILSRDVSIV